MPIILSEALTVTASIQRNLDPIDLSRVRELVLEVELTGNAGGAAADKLDVYLQSRNQAGIWDDRIHLTQIAGDKLATLAFQGVLRSDQQLVAGEQISTESGGSTGSRLAAATVKNGAFPGRYRNHGVGTETGWRLDFQVTTDTAPSFPIKVTLQSSVETPRG